MLQDVGVSDCVSAIVCASCFALLNSSDCQTPYPLWGGTCMYNRVFKLEIWCVPKTSYTSRQGKDWVSKNITNVSVHFLQVGGYNHWSLIGI